MATNSSSGWMILPVIMILAAFGLFGFAALLFFGTDPADEPQVTAIESSSSASSASFASSSAEISSASSVPSSSEASTSSWSSLPDEPAVPSELPDDFPRIDGATERGTTKSTERGFMRYDSSWNSPRGISDISTEMTRKLTEAGWTMAGSDGYGGAVNYYTKPTAEPGVMEYARVGYGYGDENTTNFFVQLFPRYPAPPARNGR